MQNIPIPEYSVAPIPACWLFKTSAASCPFDLETGVRVTCDVGYLCDSFNLLGLSVLKLCPMYATDRRQTKASLNASGLWGGVIATQIETNY